MSRSRQPPPSNRRRRRRRERTRRDRRRRKLLLVLLVGIPLVVLAAGAIGGTVALGSGCDLKSLTPVAIGQNSFVYAANGQELGVIPAERNRTPVARGQMSPWIPKATVAIEDRRFYQHGGIDPIGILRAVVADVRARKIVEGGSTITQELVRNLYLSRERTLQRKLVEACLAIKLSEKWSKARILTAYLNEVFYGNHSYGIEAASETYFSKHARDLTLDEAALLAGLPQAPSFYDPFRNPAAALARRNEVLHALLVNGDITSLQYQRARADTSLHLHPGRRFQTIREPFFFAYVEDLLQQEYGSNTVREGGLKVYTTIVPALQRAATAAIAHTLDARSDPAGAVVSIDPRTGAIRAMTAVTPGQAQNQFNFVTSARRQPGSTFKPITLATAVEQGMNPFTTSYLSAPLHYQPDSTCDPSAPGCAWNVTTYEHTYAGVESVEAATLQSDNTVYARLALDVGPANIVRMAQRLGVRESLDPTTDAVPSITLGSIAVTPLEMASVYATLAAGGVYAKPMAITKVVLPSGKVDTDAGWGRPQRERVVPDWVASTVTQVLEQNMLHGTGVAAHVGGHTDAGKTGTTENYADGWFCGYTPQLEATVWIGYPKGEIPMLDVHGAAVSGPTLPAEIWHTFMTTAIGGRPDVAFPPARSQPTWISWHGQWQDAGGPGYASRPASTTTASTATATAPAPSTTTTATAIATAAAPGTSTVAPPPPETTTVEPPPTDAGTTTAP